MKKKSELGEAIDLKMTISRLIAPSDQFQNQQHFG